MAGVLTNQGMGNLMQDDLFNFMKAAIFNQVTADGNSLGPKVALTGSIDGSIKAKGIMNDPVLNKQFPRKINGLLMS